MSKWQRFSPEFDKYGARRKMRVATRFSGLHISFLECAHCAHCAREPTVNFFFKNFYIFGMHKSHQNSYQKIENNLKKKEKKRGNMEARKRVATRTLQREIWRISAKVEKFFVSKSSQTFFIWPTACLWSKVSAFEATQMDKSRAKPKRCQNDNDFSRVWQIWCSSQNARRNTFFGPPYFIF